MPEIIVGNTQYSQDNSIFNDKFDYSYPEGLDLTPGSKLHNKIKDEVMERAFYSARVMKSRHPQWNKLDMNLTTYIPIDDNESRVIDKDPRKPVSVVFPYSYTVLETLLSFYTTTFIQDPIFRYEGTGPNDVIGAILLEKLIAQQCLKNKVGLAMHTQARDAFVYGLGVATPTWVAEYGKKSIKSTSPGFFGMGKKTKIEYLDNQLLFEGNALENIDPYLYLPDPTVPIHDPQRGEYQGWVYTDNYPHLLATERNDDEIFNVKYLRGMDGRRTSIFIGDNSGRWIKTGMSTRNHFYERKTKAVDIIKMFIRLIPKDWELGDSEYPELWYFELASDEIVIKAHPANLDHNKFPISVIVPDFDGYSLAPISRIETLYGMQGILDFLFNSHVANVRKAVNDMIIYDPYQVNGEDLKNPSPGKLIRLRRPAWGKGVKDVAQQLMINDVTRSNVQDSTWVVQWMDRISGADQSMQGAQRNGGPERLTGTEFQGTRQGALGRMARLSKIVGLQGLHDIGMFFGSHNKQMMQNSSYIKLAGDWQQVLINEYGDSIDRGRITINPEDLDINYNVSVKDAATSGGNYTDNWVQLYQILAGNPQLAQNFDMVRIFEHIARNMGAMDVNDFVKKGGSVNPQMMPNDQVQQQVQQGNLQPMPGSSPPATAGIPGLDGSMVQ